MANRLPDCPVCASNSRIYKFSQVYIASITETANRSEADRTLLSEVFQDLDDPAQRQAILALFSPPMDKTFAVRSMHPDLLVFLAGLALFAFLTTSFLNQIQYLWMAYLGLAVLIILYLIFRRRLLTWLHVPGKLSADVQAAAGMVRGWVSLYYCAKDHCVFAPGRDDWAGLEDVYHYLGGE